MTKRKGEAGETVKAALAELRTVESVAAGLGLTLDTVYSVRWTQGGHGQYSYGVRISGSS